VPPDPPVACLACTCTQVESSEFSVVDGTLKLRDNQDAPATAATGDSRLLEASVGGSGSVLRVGAAHVRRKLSSALPDAYFKELKHFEVTNNFGTHAR